LTPNELVGVGTDIVRQATTRGAIVRLLGGVAVYARCPSIETHPKLQRAYTDLDLIAAQSAWSVLPDLFISRGFKMERTSSTRAVFRREGLTADVRGTEFRDWFSFNLAPRLPLDQITLPLADLLVLKLQRFKFVEKDIQDAIALLLDHRVSSDGDEETIDRDYLYRLTNRNWGLWTTVFDNTVSLEKILDKYLDLEEAQLVWRRIELIQEVMDGKGKSLGWWLRWVPNKRIRWYRVPSD
jgi:hypothetical protein